MRERESSTMHLATIVVILSSMIFTSHAQQTSTNLDDLINKIFQTQEGPDATNNAGNPNPNPNTNTDPFPNPDQVVPTPTKTTILEPSAGTPPPNTDGYKSCGLDKECVPRFLCKNDTIVSDGAGIIDIRINGEDCSYLEICCDIPNQTNKPIIPIVPPVQHEGCGFLNPDGVGFKIVGNEDNEAQFGEFPWMCAILREEEAAGEILNLYECGGALIAPTVVLTAAHCVQNRAPNNLLIRAGEWDTQTKNEVLPHQDRRVQEIIVHEYFHKGTLHNDIALLIVDSPFQWEENVRPICLPPSNAIFDYSRCFATGWGKDKFGREGQYQLILKKIDLPVVPHDQCEANLRTTRLGRYFQLHESFICAGGEKGKDTCKGDGGSPLVCPVPGSPNRFYQAGIVAWGIGCGVENIPGVYGSVPHLRSWVDEKLSQRGIDFRFFTAS